jgi:hypothetical protein
VRHSLRARPALGERDELGVELDADRPRAAPGRGDHQAAVTGAEVVHDVARAHLRHRQHALDERLGRRHPDHVLARLPLPRLARLLGRLRLWRQRRRRPLQRR